MSTNTQIDPVTDFQNLEFGYKTAIETISTEGPQEKDYLFLANFFNDIDALRKNGVISEEEIKKSRKWFGGAMETAETMQGHVCLKPFGYDGDYRIIDKIYRHHASYIEKFGRWDRFFHQGLAAKAVRNRKEYFLNLLSTMSPDSKVLNLASGPCTDLLEYSLQSDASITFHNIDLDENAIAFAKSRLNGVESFRAEFEHINILKFKPSEQYDLIWSAGLFDYFDDKIFGRLLKRFTEFVKPGGKIVIGNFSTRNSSRPYMEYGNWFLNHRDEQQLINLGNFDDAFEVKVEKESLGVNLFLTLERK